MHQHRLAQSTSTSLANAPGIVVLPVLALAFYVVRTSRPGRFRLSVEGGWKQIKLSIEVDAKGKPDELP